MNSRIRDLREDADFTQAQIASYLNMSQTGYSKYETGENDIPTAVWKALADFYQVSVDYLMRRTDVREPYPSAAKMRKRCYNKNRIQFVFRFLHILFAGRK